MKTMAKQKALDYIMYMILGSYFTKTVCKSPIREKQLMLYYKDLSSDDQVDMENLCIRYVEKFKAAVPAEFWEQEMEVHFEGHGDNVIRFQSDKNIVYVRTEYKGKKSAFRLRLLTKKEPCKVKGGETTNETPPKVPKTDSRKMGKDEKKATLCA